MNGWCFEVISWRQQGIFYDDVYLLHLMKVIPETRCAH